MAVIFTPYNDAPALLFGVGGEALIYNIEDEFANGKDVTPKWKHPIPPWQNEISAHMVPDFQ